MKWKWLLGLLLVSFTTFAQQGTLKKVMELQMPEGDGTRGAAVAYDSLKKQYIASFAGNSAYPLAVFDKSGKLVSDPSLLTGADVRSLWVEKDGSVYCTTYPGTSVYRLSLKSGDAAELIDEFYTFPEQAVGTYHPGQKMLYFLEDNFIKGYPFPDADPSLLLTLDIDVDDNTYNGTSVVWIPATDKSFRFGLLNLNERSIDVFDPFTGKKTGAFQLPENAPLNESFNFSYANGIFWLFNIELRKWMGYK